MALTATNVYGNNTNTKNNYITVTAPNQVIVYPSGEKTGYATGTPWSPARFRLR